ncbi:hypothetical protein SAMN04488129_11867 [Halomonas daqiaonensis]|uniref:Uncharacterized protein n=1 Tax=Halomonas daqiaonensis TaxID=650850 RepID=A0A1H7TVU1_9GAMM|nr:hypothetical protein SAMN04488129_11867 [Halomonas daqiaonensis]
MDMAMSLTGKWPRGRVAQNAGNGRWRGSRAFHGALQATR